MLSAPARWTPISFGCKPRRCLGRPRKGQVLVAAPKLPTTAIERSRRKSALVMSLPRRRRAARAVVWMLRFFLKLRFRYRLELFRCILWINIVTMQLCCNAFRSKSRHWQICLQDRRSPWLR